MDITKIGLPIQFQRTTPNALDSTSVVSTTTELYNLSGAATSYLGMQVFNVEDQTLYVLITSAQNNNPHFYALGGNNSSAGTEASTQLETVSSTLQNNITSLSSSVFGAVGEALTQQISALSAFDTITELASAVQSLSSYKTSSNFLSASSPTISTGDLKLASGSGIKTSSDKIVVDSSGNVIATALFVGESNSSNTKITVDGVYAAADYYIKTDGTAKVGALTAASLELGNGAITSAGAIGAQSVTASGAIQGASLISTGALSAAAGKFVVDDSGNVTIGKIGETETNLTVTGNLSVLGTTTYLDTEVTTMSAISAVLNSDSATTLAVKQTGNYAIATFENNSGVQLKVSNNGSLSAAQAATFASTVDVSGKLTVNADISSTKTVYASAAQFSSTLEVGDPQDSSVLYVNASGVGINTEDIEGYSLKVAGDANSGNGTLYVAGSAAFGSYATFESTGGEVATSGSGSTKTISLTGNKRAVNWETMWTYISALDGGSF